MPRPSAKLIHYSAQPLGKALTVVQRREPHFKPQGLWVSTETEDGWRQWCQSEGFRLNELVVSTEIMLCPWARILHLSSPADIHRFTKKYCVYPFGKSFIHFFVDWTTVASRYDGIMIMPYQYSCRFDPMWYYAWDCASGCIWNSTAIIGKRPHVPDRQKEDCFQ